MTIDLHVYHHFPASPPDPRMDQVITLLNQIITQGQTIMATLDETLAVVRRAAAGSDSLIALFEGLKQQLADILAGVTLPPAVQAQIDTMFAEATANADKVQAELDANPKP